MLASSPLSQRLQQLHVSLWLPFTHLIPLLAPCWQVHESATAVGVAGGSAGGDVGGGSKAESSRRSKLALAVGLPQMVLPFWSGATWDKQHGVDVERKR